MVISLYYIMAGESEPRVIRDAIEVARNAGSDNLPPNLSSKSLSETALAAFAQFPSRAWLKESFENGHFSYRGLAFWLEGFEPKEKVQILTYFFGHKGVNFPNGEDLGRFLAGVNNDDFFNPTQEPNSDIVQSLVYAYLGALSLEPVPVELARARLSKNHSLDDLRNSLAWNQAQDSMLSAANLAGRDVVQTEVERAGRDFVNIALYDLQKRYIPRPALRKIARPHHEAPAILDEVRQDVQMACQWIVVLDLMAQEGYTGGNPFIPKVKLDELGLVRISFIGDTNPDTQKVVVTVPEIILAA